MAGHHRGGDGGGGDERQVALQLQIEAVGGHGRQRGVDALALCGARVGRQVGEKAQTLDGARQPGAQVARVARRVDVQVQAQALGQVDRAGEDRCVVVAQPHA